MSESRPMNPPAFPHEAPGWATCSRCGSSVHRAGMSLRDYLAAHAPEAPGWFTSDFVGAAHEAAWRYTYADAMLKARTGEST